MTSSRSNPHKAALLALALALLAIAPVGAHRASSCDPSPVLSVQDEGTATQAAIFVVLHPHRACYLSGRVQLEILQDGRRANITGNPITVRVAENGAHAWWANWCGSPNRLSVV